MGLGGCKLHLEITEKMCLAACRIRMIHKGTAVVLVDLVGFRGNEEMNGDGK